MLNLLKYQFKAERTLLFSALVILVIANVLAVLLTCMDIMKIKIVDGLSLVYMAVGIFILVKTVWFFRKNISSYLPQLLPVKSIFLILAPLVFGAICTFILLILRESTVVLGDKLAVDWSLIGSDTESVSHFFANYVKYTLLSGTVFLLHLFVGVFIGCIPSGMKMRLLAVGVFFTLTIPYVLIESSSYTKKIFSGEYATVLEVGFNLIWIGGLLLGLNQLMKYRLDV